MQYINDELKEQLGISPKWLQLVWQAYLYGFGCWLLDCEETEWKQETLDYIFKLSDNTILSFPKDIIQGFHSKWSEKAIESKYTKDQIEDAMEEWFETCETIIDPTIFIMRLLYDGEQITEEKWLDLHKHIMDPNPIKPKHQQKTRRVRGRRAITPIRRNKKGLRASTKRNNK